MKTRKPDTHLARVSGLFRALSALMRHPCRCLAVKQASQAKSDEQLKLAMEGANDGIWDVDLRTNMVSLNPRGHEMFGHPHQETVPINLSFWNQSVHPDDLPDLQATLEALLAGHISYLCVEHRLKNTAGKYVWVLARGKVSERDASGHPVRITGTFIDTTARKLAESQAKTAQLETAKLLDQAQQARQVLLSVVEDLKRADEALKEERMRLASIIKGTNVGTWEWTIQTGELAINERWAEIVGYTAEELSPVSIKTWADLVHPDDFEASAAMLKRHFKGEQNYYECECRMKHKNERWVWVLDRGSVTSWTADGKPLLMSGTHTDITTHKVSEIYRQLSSTVLTIINESDDFRTSIQQILAALKQATECDAVGMRLQNGDDFPYFSESGLSPDFLRAENTLTVCDPLGGLFRGPDGKPHLECTCGLVLSGKTDPSNPLFTPGGSCWTNDSPTLLELPSDKDPRLHPRNRCIREGYSSIALIPIHANAEIVGLLQLNDRKKSSFTPLAIKALEEIADRIGDALVRKRAENERKRLMAAIEQSGEIILITDPKGIIQYVNPTFVSVTGYSREEAVGKNARILRSGQMDDAFYSNLWQTLTSGKKWTGRIINKRKNGTLFTEDATISPVRDEAGQVVNFVAVKRDITEHLQMTAQLLQAQKMESIGRLAGGVAHDFNNMLAVILGNTELAMNRVDHVQPLFADLLEIKKAAERSADLTRQLLAFARKQTVIPKVIDLTATVEGTLKMLQRLLGAAVELVWLPGTGDMTVKLDPSQIDQILANLAVNARDAIAGAGRLVIETRNTTFDQAFCDQHADTHPGEYAMLAVNDNGCGMDKKTIEHIFEPFFTTKKVGEGTGLGLATVYGIVKQNHGLINVYSEPGMGTTFKIYLPLFKDKAESVAEHNSAPPISRDNETVLLVEDEPSILNMTKIMLEKLGYRVLTATGSDEAIGWAESHPGSFHVLLTDMVMPKMNGSALSLRLQKLHPNFKTLFMSGYTAEAFEHGGLNNDAYFMQKPFSMSDLGTKLREVLERK
jgi:PAS domain S-box-containing protein